MKNKVLFIFLPILIITSIVVNSCKKDSQAQIISTLFTNGTWQLASVLVFNYLGSSQLPTDTLNTTCDTTQNFTFPTTSTCTYSNFACLSQKTSAGTWSLTSDQLFLMSDMKCTDTVRVNGVLTIGTTMPFAYAKIVNLGQYSLILQTGDIATYFTPTTKRRIVQYGFVRVKLPTGN